MQWKDSGEPGERTATGKEEYFDEERYSPWSKRRDAAGISRFSKIPVVFILLGLAIVTSLAALMMLLLGNKGENANNQQLTFLQDRVKQLEERLDKYESIDEKVTRIWEQAKSFEKFKDRFDRSEASMSLRMDHITMSLEVLQKQFAESRKSISASAAAAAHTVKAATAQSPATGHYHTVAVGDTFYSISKRYEIAVIDLLKMNGLEKDSILQVGQKLLVQKSQNN